MTDLPDRAYVSMRPRERFHVAVSAVARGDMVELDRLIDTCPQEHYKMTDDKFMRPLRAFGRMAQDNQADITSMVLAGMTVGALLGHVESEGDEESAEAVGGSLDRGRKLIRSTLDAWDKFCEEIGIAPEDRPAFAAHDELLSFPLSILEIESSETDPAMVEKRLAKLRERWETLR